MSQASNCGVSRCIGISNEQLHLPGTVKMGRPVVAGRSLIGSEVSDEFYPRAILA